MANSLTKTVPTRVGWIRDWPRWVPYAAVAWSVVYAALGLYWAVSGHGFPYATGPGSEGAGPIAGKFGLVGAWIIVIAAGIPAAVLGGAMLRGARHFRLALIVLAVLLAGVLMLVMTDYTLLVMVGYIPYAIVGLITGGRIGQIYLQSLAYVRWILAHQLLCIVGGFLWLLATVSYARRSAGACLYCGRRDSSEGWNSPQNAARWGRIAVFIAMLVPAYYAVTRYAWVLGIPLGMTEESLRRGQESGEWISGAFLATFGLVGAMLMFGLVQHWGEVFPRWMIGLAGRRVPVALAVVPASIVSVLLTVGGITTWSSYAQMNVNAAAIGQVMWIVVGPVLLFPVWGAALAVATLGYYYRRRGPCGVCGLGVSSKSFEPLTSNNQTSHTL